VAERLSGSLQENLLYLLCYGDNAYHIIRNTVPANLFSTDVYRDIVQRVYAFIDQFKKPPKDHLPDLLEEVRKGKKGKLYDQVLEGLFEVKDNLNEEYILKSLDKFTHLQQLKIGITQAVNLMAEDKIEEAEVVLEAAMKNRLALFNPGMTLEQGLNRIKSGDFRESFKIGIPSFDKLRVGPARKELNLLIGTKKAGKTWWLIHLAKMALLAGWRVSYITLEVGEALLCARIMQSLFSLTMNVGERVSVTTFKRNSIGQFESFDFERIKRPDILTRDGEKIARKRLKDFPLHRLRVKEFPTGTLTPKGVEAYLDSMARIEKFVPDLVIVDYPGIMKLDPKNIRVDLGAAAVALRGIAVDRNIAMATVGQSNREGIKARTVTDAHTAEDISQQFTTDVSFTYSQTPLEYQLGTARVTLQNSRVSRQHKTVMVSQCYDLGQFCLDSSAMVDDYFNLIKKHTGKDPFKEGDGGEEE
jgi:hypothetical protein